MLHNSLKLNDFSKSGCGATGCFCCPGLIVMAARDITFDTSLALWRHALLEPFPEWVAKVNVMATWCFGIWRLLL